MQFAAALGLGLAAASVAFNQDAQEDKLGQAEVQSPEKTEVITNIIAALSNHCFSAFPDLPLLVQWEGNKAPLHATSLSNQNEKPYWGVLGSMIALSSAAISLERGDHKRLRQMYEFFESFLSQEATAVNSVLL